MKIKQATKITGVFPKTYGKELFLVLFDDQTYPELCYVQNFERCKAPGVYTSKPHLFPLKTPEDMKGSIWVGGFGPLENLLPLAVAPVRYKIVAEVCEIPLNSCWDYQDIFLLANLSLKDQKLEEGEKEDVFALRTSTAWKKHPKGSFVVFSPEYMYIYPPDAIKYLSTRS